MQRISIPIGLMLLLLTALGAMVGCAKQSALVSATTPSLPVDVMNLEELRLPIELSYIGILGSGEIRKLSFKLPGKLSSVLVKKGDKVQVGQKLASLSTTDVNFAFEAASASLAKAKLAYEDAQKTYAKLQTLQAGGYAAGNDVDKAKLDLDVKALTYKQAQVDVDAKQNAVSDSTLLANMNGYIVDVLNQEGEVVAAGYPVIILRSLDDMVDVGLSSGDVAKIPSQSKAKIDFNGKELSGTVENIAQTPDAESRTYNAEIKLDQPLAPETFRLGATAKVWFQSGEQQGIWIPIASVLNDGADYVYLAKDGRAVKRNIHLAGNQGFQVLAEGLKAGEQLVTSGMKELQEGSALSVKNAAGGK